MLGGQLLPEVYWKKLLEQFMGVNSIMVYGCQVLLYESQKYKGLKGFVFSLLPNLGNKRVFLGQGNACDTNIQKEGCDNIE